MPEIAAPTLIHKARPTRGQRLIGAVLSVLDPRAYLHAFRLLHHYNQTHVIPRRSLTCGSNPHISATAQFANPTRIHLGARPHIGSGCILWAGPGHGEIKTGDDLLLGPNVLITAANYRFRDGSPVTRQPMQEQSITIGHDVWIGANAVLLPGTQIGNHAIIAAGAIVRGTVPDGAVMAGVPAKCVGQR